MSVAEMKQIAQEMGETFHEFKKGIDERVDRLEKGQGIADVESKLDAMNDRFDELENIKHQLEALEAKGNRPGKTGSDAEQNEYKEAFGKFLRKGSEDGLADLMAKATSVGTDADGGYAVPETLDTNILQLERDSVVMRSVCNQMSASNEEYKKLVNLGGAGSGWVGETAARPETSSPTLAQLAPVFGEIYANPAATQKSLDDLMFDVEGWLTSEVTQEFAEQENLAFTTGNGTNKPKGILSYTLSTDVDGTRALGEIQYRLSGTDSALGADDATAVDNLLDLEIDLKAAYRNGAAFMMPRSVLRLVRKLRDTNGELIWRPGFETAGYSTLLGYRVVENEDLPAAGAESNSVLFGNFMRGYTIVDVRGTRVLRDPYTNKPYVHFYTTKRVGGFVTDSQAIKVLRLGNGA